jgi:beta-galactosidase
MAFNTSAALRQLRIMKAMGVNGIRTSHNPAAPVFLDLCDSLGFVVMSETFDVWKGHKNPYDYHLYWDEWYKRDFVDHVKRDRNHPSLFIWCLGNEAQEQWHSKADGTAIPIALAAIVDSLDGTRPTTIANNELSKANPVLMSSAVDLIGYNYNHKKWASFPQDHPGKKFIVTESTSALESRGTYDLVPYDSSRMWPERWDIPFSGGNEDRNISAYDNVFTPWGSNHQTSLRLMERYDHIAGMYVWTGFDYLGEPTPYTWPARSSYFGIVDLAGFPKDVYYLYQSVWTEKPVLHVLPHWNWKQGDRVDIVVYFNQADRVELYLNGKKIGEQSKDPGRYDLVFKAVEFEPGEIEVISFQGGKKLLSKTIRTAGRAHRIQLSSENVTFNSANKELSFVHAYIVDEFGTIVPDADDKIEFEVEGDAAKIVATDNGNTTDLTSFQSASRNAFHGKVLAIVTSKNKGKIRVRAKSEGLISGDIQLEAN